MPEQAETRAGPLGYVLAELPSLSQTFVLGELRELLAQGEDVRLLVLQREAADGGLHQPGTQDLLARASFLPPSRTAQLGGLLHALVRQPGPTLRALRWSTRWALRTGRPNELVRLARTATMVRALPPGTRHLHAHFAHGPASAAFLLSTLTGVPFSFTAHARDMFELSPVPMLREKVRAAAFVVAISEHGRRHLLALTPDRRDRIRLVRNGIDLAAFGTAAGRTPAEPSVLAVSRLVPKKGLDLLVEACRLLRRDGLDVRLDLVGDGPLDQALRAQAAQAGVADLVRFHGALAQPGVIERYASASVFALPCRVDAAGDQDGLPVSIVEAMAAGLPVVSTPVAGVPEVVVDGVNGLLVPPDDAAALADALRRLLTSRALREELARGALRTAAGYDRRTWVGVLRTLFPSVRRVSAEPPEASPSSEAEFLVGDWR